MALYFYLMEGEQWLDPAVTGRPETREVAASGHLLQSRFITDPADYQAAVEKIERAFQAQFPGSRNLILKALNRLDV